MEIAKIQISATTGRCLSRRQIPARLVGGTVSVEFADPIWDRLSKTVVFRCGESRIAEFDGTTAIIPWEILEEPGKRLYFGIWGNAPDAELQIPLIEVSIGVVETATDPGADPGTDPTLPVWADLKNRVENLEQNGTGGPGTPGQDGEDGGYYTPEVSQVDENTMKVSFTASKEGMAAVEDQKITLPPGKNGADGKTPVKGQDYFTETERNEIVEAAAALVKLPEAVQYVPQELSEEQQEQARANIGAQPVGEYLTEVPEGYAKNEDIEKVDRKVDTLREVVSKFHSNIVEEDSGEIIVLDDSSDLELQGLKVFGKTIQNGTPTPEVPVALESVGDGGSVGVTVTGKNLCPGVKKGAYGNVNGIFNSSYSPYYCTEKIIIEPGTRYSVSSPDFVSSLVSHYWDTDGNWLGKFQISEPTPDTAKYMAVNAMVDNTIRLQIEKGETATEYEPYKEAQGLTIQKPADVPVFLPGIPVASGGNYTDKNGQLWICDEVDFENGVYVQRVKKAVFDGNADVRYGSSSARAVIDLPDAKILKYTENMTMTNLFAHNTKVYTDANREPGFCQSGYGLMFRLDSTSQSTVTDNATLKAWLDAHPLEVVYILAETIEHNLSAEELAQYAALHTNYPNTTIFNDVGADMEVKYVADTKLYVDKKFAELAQAMLSQ